MTSAAFLTLVATGCIDGSAPSRSAVSIEPVLSREAGRQYGELASAGLALDNMRIRVERADGHTAAESAVTLVPGLDSIVLQFTVTVMAPFEELTARVELRVGTLPLFAGSSRFIAVPGGEAVAAPVLQPLGGILGGVLERKSGTRSVLPRAPLLLPITE